MVPSSSADTQSTRSHRPLLVDSREDERLRSDGLACGEALRTDEVRALAKAYWATVPRGETGLSLDHLRDDRRLVAELSEIAAPYWDRVFERLVLPGHWPAVTAFIIKHPDAGSAFQLHRDVSANDDRLVPSFTIWIPLVDVSPALDNGTLEVVPGSHRIRRCFDGVDETCSLAPYRPSLEERATPLSAQAGTALIYDVRLVHGSKPNRGPDPRPAIGCMVGRTDDPVVHYHPTSRRRRVMFEVGVDLLRRLHPAELLTDDHLRGLPVLDSFDVDPYIEPWVVQRSVGGDREPEREILVPSDLLPPVRRRHHASACLIDRLGPDDRPDIVDEAACLDRAPALDGSIELVDVDGAVSAASLAGPSSAATSDTLSTELARTLAAIGPWEAVVIADPWSRFTLSPRGPEPQATTVAFLVCPAATAGFATPTHAAEAEPWMVHRLTPAEPTVFWNRGPGPMVLVIDGRPD